MIASDFNNPSLPPPQPPPPPPPPPKYNDAIRIGVAGGNGNNSFFSTAPINSQPIKTTTAATTTTTTTMNTNINGTAGGDGNNINNTNNTNTFTTSTTVAPPFRVNLISSTTPIFGPNPVETDCPYCQAHVVTSVKRIPGTLPWIIMGICFLLGFFLIIPWCLCCVPFCMDNCRDAVHLCPACKRTLGRFTRV